MTHYQNLDPIRNPEVMKALILAAMYLESCGEDVMASNLRQRIFGFDPKGNSI